MWLDIAIALSCCLSGVVCGWIIRAVCLATTLDIQAFTKIVDHVESGGRGLRDDEVAEVAERLRSYASAMASDVDAHQTRVQAVNNTLNQHDGETPPELVDEAVDELIAANEAMQKKLQEAQDRIQAQATQLESAEQRAKIDALTRIPNRGVFDDHLENRFTLGPGQSGTLVMLDIDHFKQFNDVYGHRAGDEVIRVVASLINARLQSKGLVARYGGEEFAVILDGCPSREAIELAEQTRFAICDRDIPFEDKRLRVTVSIGLAERTDEQTKEQWLQRADDALYRSKSAGRNCGHWMDGDRPVLIESGSPRKSESAVHVNSANSATRDPILPRADEANPPSPESNTTDEPPRADLPASLSDRGPHAEPEPTDPRDARSAADPQAQGDRGSCDPPPSLDRHADDSRPASADDASSDAVASERPQATSEHGIVEEGEAASSEVHPDQRGPGREHQIDGTEVKQSAAEVKAHGASGQRDLPRDPPTDAARASQEPDFERPSKQSRDEGGRAFHYLPDAEELAEAMSDLHGSSQSARIQLFVMAICFDREVSRAATRSLLQVVRATLRSVDRIGCDDDQTLLVCMPNLNEETARQRGEKIVHSVDAMQTQELESGDAFNIAVGIGNAAEDDDFLQVVSRVKAAASAAKSRGHTPVQLADRSMSA
jgi:diguanylate cyclase (GGDEF)-like protein